MLKIYTFSAYRAFASCNATRSPIVTKKASPCKDKQNNRQFRKKHIVRKNKERSVAQPKNSRTIEE
jgi:hypothetical protein